MSLTLDPSPSFPYHRKPYPAAMVPVLRAATIYIEIHRPGVLALSYLHFMRSRALSAKTDITATPVGSEASSTLKLGE